MADNPASPTDFNATFNITLKDENNHDGHLRPGKLSGDLLDATLTGTAAINLKLASNLGTAKLPDIATDLNVNWGFTAATVDATLDAATFGNVPTVAFKNVSIGLGSFFSNLVGPVLTEVAELTAPVQPIIHALTQKIGFLHELGVEYSLLDLARTTGEIDQATQDRLELIDGLLTFIAVARDGGSARIDLGDFTLGGQGSGGDLRAAAFLLANALPKASASPHLPVPRTRKSRISCPEKPRLKAAACTSRSSRIRRQRSICSSESRSISSRIMCRTSTSVRLDLINSPIFGPFGVRLEATVEAHAFLDIGYDSTGLVQFSSTGDTEDIFNGFYVVDHPGPEVTLTALLMASAEANVGFAQLGVGGGITGTLNAFFNDTDSRRATAAFISRS